MKKIRYNVFETNSSSTHSITVRVITEVKSIDIFEKGVLYPSRLNIETSGSAYSGIFQKIVCRTKYEKAAIVAHYIKECDLCELLYSKEIAEDDENSFKEELYRKLKESLNINKIDFESDPICHLSGYSEEGNDFYGETKQDYYNKLTTFLNIISDGTKEIVDEYESNG